MADGRFVCERLYVSLQISWVLWVNRWQCPPMLIVMQYDARRKTQMYLVCWIRTSANHRRKNELPHQVAVLRSPSAISKMTIETNGQVKRQLLTVTLTTVVTQTFWYTGCRYLNHGNKTANINVKKNCSLSISYNGEMTHRKRQK